MLMELLKDMESTYGQMEVLIKVISSMEFGMATAFGRTIKKSIKETIEWTKKKDLECTNG